MIRAAQVEDTILALIRNEFREYVNGGYFEYDPLSALNPRVSATDDKLLRWDKLLINIESSDLDFQGSTGQYNEETGTRIFNPKQDGVVITVLATNETITEEYQGRPYVPGTELEVMINVFTSIRRKNYGAHLQRYFLGKIETLLLRNPKLVHPVSRKEAAEGVRYGSSEVTIDAEDSVFAIGSTTQTWMVTPKSNGFIEINPLT